MNNFSIFNKEQVAKAIEPFLPGISGHITPIAYQAWTPDIFLFLFRTTDPEDREHFFVSVSYDYLSDGKEEVAAILKEWKNLEVLEFFKPHTTADAEYDEDEGISLNKLYKAHLVRVTVASNLGYWANKITITKDSDIDVELVDFTDAQRDAVKRLLTQNKEYVISVYRNNLNEMELFYNYKSSV